MNVEKITLVKGTGPDVAILETDLPSSMPEVASLTTVKLEIAAGMGESYISDNFPNIPMKVVALDWVP